MSGCQKNKTEIMLDGQDTVSESETQDDTQAGNDATEDLAEAKISAEAELSEMPVETEPEMIFVDVCGAVMNPGVYETGWEQPDFSGNRGSWWIFAGSSGFGRESGTTGQ